MKSGRVLIILFSVIFIVRANVTWPAEGEIPLGDLSIEELMGLDVISSTQQAVRLPDAPSTISVVTGEQIRRWGIRKLSELIERLIPGAYAVEDADDLILGFRGVAADNNAKVLLLINGHTYNTQWNNGASSEVELGLMKEIKQVEVINGPGGALYGSGATIAVINLITRSGRDFQGVEVTGNYGTGDYRRGELLMGGTNDSLDYLFSMGGLSADGYTNNHREPLNISLYPPGYRFFGNVNYNDFQLMSRFTRSQRDLYNIDTTLTVTTTYDTFFVVGRQEFTPNDRLKLSVEGSYDTLETQRHDMDSGIKIRAIGEDRYGLKVTGITSWDRHDVVFGAEYRRDQFGEDWSGDNFNFFVVRDANGNIVGVPTDPYNARTVTPYGRNVYGLFAQDTIQLSRTYSLLLGLRYDRIESPKINDKDAITPRVALVMKPGEKTVLKAMFSSGFRQPIAVLTSPDGFFFGNDGARFEITHPEKFYSLELSGSYRWTDSANLAVNVFYDSIRDIHGVDPQAIPTGVFISSGRIDYVGFEATADLNLPKATFLRVIYQHVQPGAVVDDVFHAFTTPDQEHVLAYPEDVTKLILDIRPSQRFSFNINSQIIWRSFGLERSRTTRSVSYALVNANFLLNLGKHLDLVLSGYNLTNEQTEIPRVLVDLVDLAERNFHVELNYKF